MHEEQSINKSEYSFAIHPEISANTHNTRVYI